MIDSLSSWFEHPALAVGGVAFSVLAVVASLLLVPRYLARLPSDFLTEQRPTQHASLAARVARNLLGVVLVLLGLLMLLLPGQGLLTLLVGVLLLDIPGKHALFQRVLGRPKVLSLVNKLRARHQVEPLRAIAPRAG